MNESKHARGDTAASTAAEQGVSRRQAMTGMLGAAMAGLSVPALSAQVRGVTPTSIKVGAMLAMTGSSAVTQVQVHAGQYAYFKMINDRGGINGRKIDYIVEDHEYSAQKAVTAARKLVMSDDIFAMIGSLGTAQLNPVLPFMEQQKVPIINSFTGTLEWFNPVKTGIFGVYTPLEYCVQACGRWAAKDGHKKIVVAHWDAAFVRAFTQYAEPGAKSVFKDATVEWLPIKYGTVDYVPHALEIIKRKPDAVIASNVLLEFVALAREMRANGSQIPIYTPPINVHETLVGTNPKAVEGIKGLSFTASPRGDTPALREYREALAKYVTPAQQPDFLSLFTWGGAKIFCEALSRIKGDVTHESLARAFYTMKNYDSGILPPVSFSPDNHLGTTSLFKMVARNGQWAATGEFIDAAKNAW